MSLIRMVTMLCMVCTLCDAPAGLAGQPTGHLHPADLRCEGRVDPLGIGDARPHLSWLLESNRRAERQTAYRILVASTSAILDANSGDLWDSGVVQSDATAHIPYRGRPLQSRQICYWKVMSFDREQTPGPWSAAAHWEMGLLFRDDWSAEWIDARPNPSDVLIENATYYAMDGSARRDVSHQVGELLGRGESVIASNAVLGGDPAPNRLKRLSIRYRVGSALLDTDVAENATAVLADKRYPYLRRDFPLSKPIERARLYVSALGVYEFYLNGRRVGTDHLAPGWTDYRRRVAYQVYDVTSQVQVGANVAGLLVGPGWFCGRAGLFNIRAFYGTTPAAIVQLEVTYQDGTIERIDSDARWRHHDGPIMAADLMDGAIYDAGAAIEDWSSPTLDASHWRAVSTRDEARELVAMVDPPVRQLDELPAVSVAEPAPGRWTFDLGQNMVGVVRLEVNEPPGTVITVRHAEMLNSDGAIYTANLRGAAATDTYICRGDGREQWTPSFTFHGFRYVEVSGLSQEPGLNCVTGVVLGSDLDLVGTFACSDQRLNQLQSNILWGLRGNYLSVPTDCPQRDERMGWTADAQVFSRTAAYNADVTGFMRKWLQDLRDAQRDDGAHSDVAPVTRGLSYGTPAWADAGTIVPWTLYELSGDRRILEENIESMIRWVQWCRDHTTGLIRADHRGNDYGDWLSVSADTPKDLIGTAYFAHSADLVGRSLEVLGRESEARQYRQLFETIRESFNERFVTLDGRVSGGTQTAYLLALRFDLLAEPQRRMAMLHLVRDIEAKGDHLSTGFLGVENLLPTLAEGGRADMAYRVLLQESFPSWLFSVRHGATTIWERWDGWTPETGPHPDWTMNSFNHYALGSCGEWFFEGICGIRTDRAKPGFAHFFIQPCVTSSLMWARGSYRSVRGEITSHWDLDGERLTLKVGIPANTTATVVVPSLAGTEILESGVNLTQADGVELVGREGDAIVLRVGSGSYAFASTQPPARSGNPVFSGWYADPEIACFEDRFWIYPTSSAPYDEQLHFDAFSSPDLVNWTRHERVLQQRDVQWARRAMWAPSVVERKGRFYFFFGANDIQSNDEIGGIGVAVSDSPAGPFVDYLGKPLIDQFHNGAQPIDQFVFRDHDGQDYLIYGGWRHCNIAKLKEDFTGFESFEDGTTFREITPEGYIEGPFMFAREGRYYFMWSEGGWTGPDYSVAYAVADSPLGPFKRIGKILQQDPTVATGAGHHSVLRVPGSDSFYIVYHRRPLGETNGNHRVVCIDRMTFDAQGYIEPVQITVEGIHAVSPPR